MQEFVERMIPKGRSHLHGGTQLISKGQAIGEERRVFYNIQGLNPSRQGIMVRIHQETLSSEKPNDYSQPHNYDRNPVNGFVSSEPLFHRQGSLDIKQRSITKLHEIWN